MSERLKLHYPVKPYRLNQAFAENKPCVIDFGKPTQKVIDSNADGTCPVGSKKLYAQFGMSGHNGADLKAGEQNVYAACDGVVIEKQKVPARGLGLGILTHDRVMLDGAGWHFAKLRYWHLKTMYVEAGDKVVAGQLLGITDNTGYSSGNHLHFELQPMDKDVGGHPYLASPNNGIGAAIDPVPFFTGQYAEDFRRITLYTALIPLLQKLLEKLKEK